MDTNPLTSPATNPDLQEALSLRYSPSALTILPLRSGNVAVYAGMPRDLIAIVEAKAGLDTIFSLTPPPRTPAVVDLADLGLI